MMWKENNYSFVADNGVQGRICIINIDSVDSDIKKMIDDTIVDICFADNEFTIKDAKNHIKKYLDTTEDDRKKGAISEFFIHMYLKSKGFKQECLYLNLEENSPKKGFDGIYTYEENIWYMESKSGSNASAQHIDKISEAYRDLRDKFAGKVKNNPWHNAINHAKVVGSSKELLSMFRHYSQMFSNQKHDIADYNIIPCGTLFLYDLTKNNDLVAVKDSVERYLKSKEYTDVIGICVSQKTKDDFEKYLVGAQI